MKRTSLLVLAVFLVGLFTGVVVLSIGVGSKLTVLNTAWAPLVCPGDDIVPAWEYHPPKGKPALAHGPELGTRWICVNEETGEAHIAGYRTILTAGLGFAVIFTLVFGVLIYVRTRSADATPKSPSS